MKVLKFNKIVYKKIWLILTISIVFSGIVSLSVLFFKPLQYESGTTIYISNKSFSDTSDVAYSDILASRSLVENYVEIIKSGMFAAGIIKKLQLEGITQQSISNKIDAVAVKNSNILDIRVRNQDRVVAKKIAEVIPLVLEEKPSVMSGMKNLTILNSPSAAKPITSGIIFTALISFVSGIIAAAAFLIFFQRSSKIIRTPEDIEKNLGLKVTGTIPDFRF